MSESGNVPRHRWRGVGLVLAVGLLALASGFWARRALSPSDSGTEPASGLASAPPVEFTLQALAGGEVSANDFSGRILVVDFWATWCGPCRLQDEILRALHARYEPDQVSFLAINVGEPFDLVREFTESDPFAYPVLMDPAQSLSAKYGIYALPTVMVLDREQRILFQNMGVASGMQVSSVIDRALGST